VNGPQGYNYRRDSGLQETANQTFHFVPGIDIAHACIASAQHYHRRLRAKDADVIGIDPVIRQSHCRKHRIVIAKHRMTGDMDEVACSETTLEGLSRSLRAYETFGLGKPALNGIQFLSNLGSGAVRDAEDGNRLSRIRGSRLAGRKDTGARSV